MIEILKNLASNSIFTILAAWGIARELRLIIKNILDYKISKSKQAKYMTSDTKVF